MIKYYSINGEIISAETASLKVNDLSILRGYAMFDYFLFKSKYPYFFEDYLERFEHSSKRLGLKIPFSREGLKTQILKLIEKNGIENGAIRLVLTGGYSVDGYTPTNPNLLILQYSTPVYTQDVLEKGVKLLLHHHVRTFPEVKTTNYIVGINRLEDLQNSGASDVLFHDGTNILETTRANFFIVTQDDVLVTASNSVLKGISRKQILNFAPKYYKVEERVLKVEELKNAKEAFITSSTKGAHPIVQIDDIVIGDGKVGPVSKDILEKFNEWKVSYIKSMVESQVSIAD